MIKWDKIKYTSRDKARGAIWAINAPYKIITMRFASKPTEYSVTVHKMYDNYRSDLMFSYNGANRDSLIAHAKKVLEKYLNVKNDKIKNLKKQTKGVRMAKRKVAGNALKQTAYALLKKGAVKLVKRRGKPKNTRYVGKISVGVYKYALKTRKG